MERRQTTISVWNVCECGAVLHSIAEAKRGVCSGCHFRAMPADTKQALNGMIAAVFLPTSKAEKERLIDNALAKLDRDKKGK